MSQLLEDLYLLFLISDTFKNHFKSIYQKCKNTEIAVINSTMTPFVVSEELVEFIDRYYLKG